ncbi:MAG: DUF4832 domain-containing protein [Sandaracinus sp.]
MHRHVQLAVLATLPAIGLAACDEPTAPDAGARDSAITADAAGLDAPGLDAPGLDAPATVVEDAPSRHLTYTASDAIFANPERGFYRAVDLLAERDLSWLRGEHANDSLVYSYVMLDRFRDSDIDAAALAAADDAFQVARDDGFEVVLRFAYNQGPWPTPDPDAPLSRIQRHLEQLTPLLHDNDDVIAVVQAGFIGAWGEWHSSSHGLDMDPAARRAVVEALLAALPPSRSTQIRTPMYISDLIGGSPLDASRAWTGTFESRIGFHDDCFLASDTDLGTYPDAEIERWKTFLDAHSGFVPVGGETCATNPPRSECASAVAEMSRHHWSFVNRDYHPDVVQSWIDGGCMPDIERRLGYRFVLLDADLPERARPGGSFTLAVHLRNEGFAAPFNARPVELVLHDTSTSHAVTLSAVEIRSFFGGTEPTFSAHIRLPATLAPGTYTLALRMPSAASSLHDRSEYAIRVANEGVWDASFGENVLGTITIDDAAPGTSDPSASTLRLLD